MICLYRNFPSDIWWPVQTLLLAIRDKPFSKTLWIHETLLSGLTSFTEVLTTEKDGQLSNKVILPTVKNYKDHLMLPIGAQMDRAFGKDKAQS